MSCRTRASSSFILPRPPWGALTVMMVRSPIWARSLSWDSFMPMPRDTMMTMEQQPMSTPSTVKKVRDFRRIRFCRHMRKISFLLTVYASSGGVSSVSSSCVPGAFGGAADFFPKDHHAPLRRPGPAPPRPIHSQGSLRRILLHNVGIVVQGNHFLRLQLYRERPGLNLLVGVLIGDLQYDLRLPRRRWESGRSRWCRWYRR